MNEPIREPDDLHRGLLFADAASGNDVAFGDWMALVEPDLRASLRRFARRVDLEVVMQESFLRMLVVARSGRALEGARASLRFAVATARNVALEECRRLGQEPPPGAPDPDPPDPHRPPDPILRQILRACIDALKGKPRLALRARLSDGGSSADRELAAGLRMRVNTFLQNITRARAAIRKCLVDKGVNLEEVWP